jgi:hypothetical protein
MMKHLTIAAALLSITVATTSTAHATGLYKCEPVDKAKWLSEGQLKAQLSKIGWKVNRMKPDGGCWEVYGTTPNGLRVEGYFHPATGEQLMLNQRGKIIFQKK